MTCLWIVKDDGLANNNKETSDIKPTNNIVNNNSHADVAEFSDDEDIPLGMSTIFNSRHYYYYD